MKKSLCILFILCAGSYIAIAQSQKNTVVNTANKDQEEISLKKELANQDEQIQLVKPITTPKHEIPENDITKYLNQDRRLDIIKNTNIEKNLESTDRSDEEKKKSDDEEIDKYEVSFNVNYDSLTNNFGTWKTSSLFAKRKSEDGKILWGEYRFSQRRSINDSEIIGGIYQPLKKRFAFTVEASYSNTNNFVAKRTIRGEIEKVFKGGWVGHAGVWYKLYDPTTVKVYYGEVEKYWGNNRIAYKVNLNNVSNVGTSPSNTISYNRYYGENINTFGIRLGFGREEEFVEPILGILQTDTISVTGSLKHWITKDFGLVVDATVHKQGIFYYRRGLNLGVRYRF